MNTPRTLRRARTPACTSRAATDGLRADSDTPTPESRPGCPTTSSGFPRPALRSAPGRGVVEAQADDIRRGHAEQCLEVVVPHAVSQRAIQHADATGAMPAAFRRTDPPPQAKPAQAGWPPAAQRAARPPRAPCRASVRAVRRRDDLDAQRIAAARAAARASESVLEGSSARATC